jgi:hemolysin III
MPIFQLKHLRPQAPGDPIRWSYDRAEVIADGVVHAFGVIFGLAGAITLYFLTRASTTIDGWAVAIYAAGLLTMLGFSAAYNLWPVSPRKWLLRRFDHSAIYLLIAATYTPFISQLKGSALASLFSLGVWSVAFVGTFLKLIFPGRFDKVSIILYLALGWSGAIAFKAGGTVLPSIILVLIAIGGGLFTFGVVFHAWERLRFQNAIWHGFVVSGAACHFSAVLGLVVG